MTNDKTDINEQRARAREALRAVDGFQDCEFYAEMMGPLPDSPPQGWGYFDDPVDWWNHNPHQGPPLLNWAGSCTDIIHFIDEEQYRLDSSPVRRYRRRLIQYALQAESGVKHPLRQPFNALEDAAIVVSHLLEKLQVVAGTRVERYDRDEWVSLPQIEREHGEPAQAIRERMNSYLRMVERDVSGDLPNLELNTEERSFRYRAGQLASARTQRGMPILPPNFVEPIEERASSPAPRRLRRQGE